MAQGWIGSNVYRLSLGPVLEFSPSLVCTNGQDELRGQRKPLGLGVGWEGPPVTLRLQNKSVDHFMIPKDPDLCFAVETLAIRRL